MTATDSTTAATADAAIRATIGRRQQQQDSARLTSVRLPDGRDALLVIVADGMGGAVGGQIASDRAVEAFAGHAAASDAPVADRLRGALNAANTAIVSAVATDPRLAGMGCTLIGAVVDGDRIDWISVGDSLLLALADGKIERLNADHSMAAVLDRSAQRGEISAAEAAASDQRHLLRSALTGDPIPMIDTGSATLNDGTRVIAATDGILTLAFERVAALAGDAATVDGAAGAIVDAVEAIMPDDQDNLTVAVAAIGAARATAAIGARSPKSKPQPKPQQRPQQEPARRRNLAALALLALGLIIAVGGLTAGVVLFFTPPSVPLPPNTAPVTRDDPQPTPTPKRPTDVNEEPTLTDRTGARIPRLDGKPDVQRKVTPPRQPDTTPPVKTVPPIKKTAPAKTEPPKTEPAKGQGDGTKKGDTAPPLKIPGDKPPANATPPALGPAD